MGGIPCRTVSIGPRDNAVCYVEPVKVATELGWSADRDLFTMMFGLWCWQKMNQYDYTNGKT